MVLLFSCVHSLGLRLDRGNILDRRERMRAHTQIAELLKIKRRLILNDTQIFLVQSISFLYQIRDTGSLHGVLLQIWEFLHCTTVCTSIFRLQNKKHCENFMVIHTIRDHISV